MKKENEVLDYVKPEVEEIELELSTVLCGGGSSLMTGEQPDCDEI